MTDEIIVWFYCGPFVTTEAAITKGWRICPRCRVAAHDEKTTHPRMRSYVRGIWPVEDDKRSWK